MTSQTKQLKKNQWQHGVVTQIPRNSLLLIMAAFTVVVLPHAFHISTLIIAAALFCVVWRWMIFLGKKSFLTFWQKATLILASGSVIIITEGLHKNIETWAALLIISFALKLLEMKTRRDAYVVIFIAYFAIAVEFIFNKSIGIVLYEICALVLVMAATVGMNQFHTRIRASESLKVSGKILAQAIPLMIVLFILFPRIGPLWAIPNPNQYARTGLGADMTPGDISKLARSDEIAFRAIFKGETPSNENLYWRGRVYANFSNGKWSEAKIPNKFSNIQKINWVNAKNQAWFVSDEINNDSEKISYSVLLEPTHDKFLIGLDLAIPKTASTGLMWDYKLTNRKAIHSLLRYEVDTFPNATLNKWLPEFLRNQTVQYDANDNPRSIAFAKKLYSQSASPESFIDNILDHIREEPYHYTLEPPTLEKQNSIDQFWFDTRQGFCSHYAGALVYMLRAAGIPARMVGGYQGGEINPLTGHIVVRQYLAHAWAEYWTPKNGWTRVDPTAAVAPSRIHDNFGAAIAENELDALSAFTNARLNGIPVLQKMMFLFESLEHRWNLLVLGYDTERQSEFLQKILGKITITKILIALLIGTLLSASFVIISLILSNRTQPKHPVIQLLQKFSSKLEKRGLQRKPEETPAQFIEKFGKLNQIDKSEYNPVIMKLNALLYDPRESISKEKLTSLKVMLNNLQRKTTIQNY
ncbi:MAG: transglutaminaseTgpA domain-containing protein [Pseudomonadota bacterium]